MYICSILNDEAIMNIKLHTPKSLKAGSGMATLKQFLLSLIATTVSIVLTFGTAAIIDNNKKQKGLINQVVHFAKEFQTHVILVAHPRKATGFIRKTDIAGTSDLTNAVDNVFIVHRVNNDFKKLGAEFFGQMVINQFLAFGNVIECCKNRQWGIMDQLFGMYYEIESRRFKNSQDEVKTYGWNDKARQETNLPFEANYQSDDENDLPF